MQMGTKISEKVKYLEKLRYDGFNVPDFIYVPASEFKKEKLPALEAFLKKHQENYKVIARSAHPKEDLYKSGSFDSVETYADIGGIKWARKRIIKLAKTAKNLSILRQQYFNSAPEIDLEQMGVIVMPFIFGTGVMAKKLWDHWEFGYCRDRIHKETEPYITSTPHDRRLLDLSKEIQNCLGFQCEIEYVIEKDGKIHVVQAKDISSIDILEHKQSERSIKMDSVSRIRQKRNYRERSVYVMDNQAFYMEIIHKCEEVLSKYNEDSSCFDSILKFIKSYEFELESFALRHQRFAILGLSINEPRNLFQIANHYLDDMPELQEILSKTLNINLYKIDIFMSEADTLIVKDKFRINLCSHDAYGIDTVRNPIWTISWSVKRHDEVIKRLKEIGFKTDDTVGVDIDEHSVPTIFRL